MVIRSDEWEETAEAIDDLFIGDAGKLTLLNLHDVQGPFRRGGSHSLINVPNNPLPSLQGNCQKAKQLHD